MPEWIFHDSQSLFFRQPFGAVPCNAKITIRLEIYQMKLVDRVFLRLWKNNSVEERIPMDLVYNAGEKQVYQKVVEAPPKEGLLWYYFIIIASDTAYNYGNNHHLLGGKGEVYSHEPPSYQITVYKEKNSTPHWFKDAVMYQIFVDRYCNGNEVRKMMNLKTKCYLYNDWHETPYYRTDKKTGKIVCYDFFGGNLLGVIKKLDYLKDLGVNVIYFNPVFEAPSNHKYDTADYLHIDSMYGTNEIFAELCRKAKEKGIYIILDGVFSHTGSESVYFNKEGTYESVGAYQSKDSPFFDWYRFSSFPDEYECWWGIDTLPNVEETTPSYQDFIINNEKSVLKTWMGLGAKGWRLDVVDELPGQFIKNFSQTLKETDKDSILIGEVWEDASNKISYGKMTEYLLGDELDSVMNYPFRNVLIEFILERISANQLQQKLMSLYENYPLDHFYSSMNLLGSHDVPRILTILGESPSENTLSIEERKNFKLNPEQKKWAIKRLQLISIILMTFPGVPCIYYGDEVGLEGYGDPLCRGTYPWGKEDNFLLQWFKKLIHIRNKYDVLRTGSWQPLAVKDGVFAFIRVIKNGIDVFGQKRKNNIALIVVNRNNQPEEVNDINTFNYQLEEMFDILDENKLFEINNGKINLLLKPLEGKILMQQNN